MCTGELTAKELMAKHDEIYMKSTGSSRRTLFIRLFNIKMREEDDLKRHLDRMMDIVDQLKATGEYLTEDVYLSAIYSSLSHPY